MRRGRWFWSTACLSGVLAMTLLVQADGAGFAGGTATGRAGRSLPSAAATPVRIGVVVGQSGPDSLEGLSAVAGVEAAASYINHHGGVDGHPIEVTYKNDDSSPATAVSEVRSLYSSGIDLVVGGMIDGSCKAMQPIVQELGMVEISPTCQVYSVPTPKLPASYFQVGPTNAGNAVAEARFAATVFPHVGKWVTSNPALGFGHTFASQFARTLRSVDKHVKVGGAQYVPLAATDFSPYVTPLEGQGGHNVGLVASTFGATLIGFTKAANAVGLFRHYSAFVADSVMGPILGALGSSAPNMWLDYTYYPSAFHNATNTQFVSTFRSLNKGQVPNAWNEMAYVALSALAQAIGRAHSTKPAVVERTMAGMRFATPEGVVAIGKTTHLVEQGWVGIHVVPRPGSHLGYAVTKVIYIPYARLGE